MMLEEEGYVKPSLKGSFVRDVLVKVKLLNKLKKILKFGKKRY